MTAENYILCFQAFWFPFDHIRLALIVTYVALFGKFATFDKLSVVSLVNQKLRCSKCHIHRNIS